MNDGDLPKKKKKQKQQQPQPEAERDQPTVAVVEPGPPEVDEPEPVTSLDEDPAPHTLEPPSLDGPRDRTGRGPWLVAGAAALVAVLAVGLAVIYLRKADDARAERDAERDDRSEAAQVAGQFVQALLTYDSDDPTASIDELESLATDEYREQIEDPRDAIVPDTGEGEDAAIVSQVDGVYIRDADADAVEAVGTVTSIFTAGGQSLPVGWYVRLELKRQGDEWRVDKV
ncbi:MAG: hypothetical protein ACRD0U_11235, partial [Acidimicrobiales bacterium]